MHCSTRSLLVSYRPNLDAQPEEDVGVLAEGPYGTCEPVSNDRGCLWVDVRYLSSWLDRMGEVVLLLMPLSAAQALCSWRWFWLVSVEVDFRDVPGILHSNRWTCGHSFGLLRDGSRRE